MNQAVFAFRRYEDASLRYTGINSHEGLTHYGQGPTRGTPFLVVAALLCLICSVSDETEESTWESRHPPGTQLGVLQEIQLSGVLSGVAGFQFVPRIVSHDPGQSHHSQPGGPFREAW